MKREPSLRIREKETEEPEGQPRKGKMVAVDLYGIRCDACALNCDDLRGAMGEMPAQWMRNCSSTRFFKSRNLG